MLSFLGNRSQMVEVNGVTSPVLPSLNMGLCQGGYSSGTLFSVHTNEITASATTPSENINNTQQPKPSEQQTKKKKTKKQEAKVAKQFVDDTTGLFAAKTHKELQTLLQQSYNNIQQHLIKLGMCINPHKTQLLFFTPTPEARQLTIQAGNTTIRHQKYLKVLGFNFSEDERMDQHLWRGDDNLIKQLRTTQSMLRIIKPFTEKKQLGTIASAVANSQILYLAPLWSLTSKKNINKMQNAQTRILRQLDWKSRKKTHKITQTATVY